MFNGVPFLCERTNRARALRGAIPLAPMHRTCAPPRPVGRPPSRLHHNALRPPAGASAPPLVPLKRYDSAGRLAARTPRLTTATPSEALRACGWRPVSAVPALQWRPLVPGRGVPDDTVRTRHGARRTVTPRAGPARRNRSDTPVPGPDALRAAAPAPAGSGAGLAPHPRRHRAAPLGGVGRHAAWDGGGGRRRCQVRRAA